MRAEEGDESIAELADFAGQAEQALEESIARLEGKRVAILATDGVERRELEEPRERCAAPGPVPNSCHCTVVRSVCVAMTWSRQGRLRSSVWWRR